MVKRRVVVERVPLESGSETMTVSVLSTTHISRNQLTSYSTQVYTCTKIAEECITYKLYAESFAI